MLGSGRDGFEVNTKRQRMMETNPYFAVNNTPAGFQPYGFTGGGGGGALGAGIIGGGAVGSNVLPFPVVRLRGLPFSCSELDIFKFFAGLDIVDVLLVNKAGRFNGEAFVVFAGPMQAEFALQRDRQNMGRRYVEVFRCKKMEYYQAVAAEVKWDGGGGGGGVYEGGGEAGSPGGKSKGVFDKEQMEYTEVLKLRGLPFSVTKEMILEFFMEFEVGEESVHIACRMDGKVSGEAYVEFRSAEEAKRAMCKDKMMIGSRYVELFPSTEEALNRSKSRAV